MRFAVIFLGLVVATGSAWAEWMPISKSDDSTYYLDPATIRNDGNLRKVWVVEDLKKREKDGDMSRRGRYEYDCKNEMRRLLSFSMHSKPMASGETLAHSSTTSEWRDIPPGTTGEDILKFVCSK